MIEEKIVIGFEEYLSYFDDTGKLRDIAGAQCIENAINKAINEFFSGATTVSHHGFSIHGKVFHAKAFISDDDGGVDLVSLNISNSFGLSVEYSFDATMKLVMTKTNNCVAIDCE